MMLNEVDKCVEDTRREGDRFIALQQHPPRTINVEVVERVDHRSVLRNLSIFVCYQTKANFQKLSEQSKDFHTHLKGIWRRKSEMD